MNTLNELMTDQSVNDMARNVRKLVDRWETGQVDTYTLNCWLNDYYARRAKDWKVDEALLRAAVKGIITAQEDAEYIAAREQMVNRW